MTEDILDYETTETSSSTELMNPYDLSELRQRILTPAIRGMRIDGKLFKLPDGQTSPGPINVIVVEFVYMNTLYKGQFNPKNITPPDCWAFSSQPDDLAPDPKKVAKIGNATCTGCPNNEWGSSQNGGKGKACQNRVVMGIITPTDPEGEMFRLTASPKGNANWNSYVRALQDRGLSFRQVTTAVSFTEDDKVPVLKFHMVDIHTVEPSVIMTRLNQVRDGRLLMRDPSA
jgi:hypothetical protein